MRNIRASILGVVLAVATIVIASFLSKPHALDLFAILLAFIAAVYLGFVLLDGHRREVVIEIVVIALFFVLAILGLWVTPYFLVIGYFAHGLWDVLHHPRAVQTKVVLWWPPFCLVYDWIVGGFIFWWWS
ncbi:MAG: hypothetical protein HY203_09660 [Nitrospirae bacterium]|nr:hypothetical protein [Nitrospirota bacterium]